MRSIHKPARGVADARKGLFIFTLVIWAAITRIQRRLLDRLRHDIRRWWSARPNCIGFFGMEAACPTAFSSTGC